LEKEKWSSPLEQSSLDGDGTDDLDEAVGNMDLDGTGLKYMDQLVRFKNTHEADR
jgi:hypothetical protein